VLIGKTRSVRRRIATILISTFAITVTGLVLAGAGAIAGLWTWPPQPSSPFGVGCGLAAAVLVFFEMAILPRKWFRGRRLGATRIWMRWHIWLGLVSLPVVLIHTGFGFGGPLPAITLALFLAVVISGIWGLVMQQWLPEKLLATSPHETVSSQIDFLGEYHALEAARLVEGLISPESEATEPVVSGVAARELLAFRDGLLLPYLRKGIAFGSPLAAFAEAEQRFARLREAVPVAALPAVDRLQAMASLRREWDAQARLNFWLHNWLLIHFPLSVAMTGLMVLHAVRALKYW
jgi:hypothetical protein